MAFACERLWLATLLITVAALEAVLAYELAADASVVACVAAELVVAVLS